MLVALLGAGCGSAETATTTPESHSTPPPEGTQYGARLVENETVALDRLIDNPEPFFGKVVRTSGTIRAVCQHRGCWFDIGAADEAGGRIHVRSTDHSVSIPMDAVGKMAEVEGTLDRLPGQSACGSHEAQGSADEEQHAGHEEQAPGCGEAAGGRRAQLSLRGAVIR